MNISTEDANRLKKLWRSRITIFQILKDRKYPINHEDITQTFNEFVEWVNETVGDDYTEEQIREDMTMVYEIPKIENSKILVIWPKQAKLGTNIRSIYDDMKEQEITRAIIIIDNSVTPNTKAIIRNLRSKKIYIDCYTLIETLFNVLEHRLVPTHTVCTPSEKKKIFDKYAIGPDQLPHIKLIDPTIRHLGAMRGNLIKIVRESETQPGYFVISYRLVV